MEEGRVEGREKYIRISFPWAYCFKSPNWTNKASTKGTHRKCSVTSMYNTNNIIIVIMMKMIMANLY